MSIQAALSKRDRITTPTCKTPKGTRDVTFDQMPLREALLDLIKDIFKKHGGTGMDTPVFELKSTLTSKYGEDSKLIFDLASHGGEEYALRYDLTVPFARYATTHACEAAKRFQIGKVYRRDEPALEKGRFREFTQADFDICGEYYPANMSDAEVILIVCSILNNISGGRYLGDCRTNTSPTIGSYRIRVNHRKLLDIFLKSSGVPNELLRPVCSALDKLDKLAWSDIVHELRFKGLEDTCITDIQEWTQLFGTPDEFMCKLEHNKRVADYPELKVELSDFIQYLKTFGCIDKIWFDMSLCRGLDYYTGIIYEVVLTSPNTKVGSIAAGGRYDNLIGSMGPRNVTAVGLSLGVDRILTVLEADRVKIFPSVHVKNLMVIVGSIGDETTISSEVKRKISQWKARTWMWLRENGYSTYIDPKIRSENKLFKYAQKQQASHIIFTSEHLLESSQVTLQDFATKSKIQMKFPPSESDMATLEMNFAKL